MSYRITTNGMLRNYQSNLYRNTWNVDRKMQTVQTGRAFNSYAEDPVIASNAFRLRRNFWNTGNQIDNSTYVISKFSTGWNSLDQIVDGNSDHPGLTGISDALRALNDPSGSARRVLGKDMVSTAISCALLMNVRYEDTFVFAGADGLNVPFSWSDDGELFYRGFSVNAQKPLTEDQFNKLAALNDGTNSLSSMEAFKKFAEYYAAQNASTDGYDEYEDWFDEVNGKMSSADFEGLQNNYSDLISFRDYVSNQAAENVTYEDYEAWYNGFNDPSRTKLTEEEFDALKDPANTESNEEYDAFIASVKESAAASTEVNPADYEAWVENLDHEPLAIADFSALYSKLGEFEQYLGDTESTADTAVYDADPNADPDKSYETWFNSVNNKLDEDSFEALDGDYSKLEGFAEYYTEHNVPSHDDYKTWYVTEYAAEGTVDLEDEKAVEAAFARAERRFDEATYVDIGIGLEFDDAGNVISSSAFNSAISGLDILGYGTDEDGDPRNALQLMRDLGKLFDACDDDTGDYPSEYEYNGVIYHQEPDGEVQELANRLTNKLHAAINHVSDQHVALDGQVNYLKKNQEQLEEYKLDMNEQIEGIEQVDPAYAIMEMNWARMCYNAALQIGGSILSQSLLDYMN